MIMRANFDIESYNNDTWGWIGCSDLQIGSYICLSSGYPPMPVNVPNAVCGPQMNGTATVPPGTDLSTINECPLNACCDIWGQCGTTSEFCTASNSSTGAPGTAAAGQNGCISNCGTDIAVAPEPPGEFLKIGYFEGYDWQRPCLAGSIASVNTSAYTHIHLAFAILNAVHLHRSNSCRPGLLPIHRIDHTIGDGLYIEDVWIQLTFVLDSDSSKYHLALGTSCQV
jgi:chitinase